MSTSSRPVLDEVAVLLMGRCHANAKHAELAKGTQPDLMNESGRGRETLELKTSGVASAWSTTCCLSGEGWECEEEEEEEETVRAMGLRERLKIGSRERSDASAISMLYGKA